MPYVDLLDATAQPAQTAQQPQAKTGPGITDLLDATAPQIGGAGRIPKMIASNVAQGAAGLLGIPGTIETGIHAARDYLGNAAYSVVTGKAPSAALLAEQKASEPGILNSNFINRTGAALGAWDRPDLQPQDTGERYLASGSRGIGAVAPIAASGGTSAIPMLASGLGSGLGSQVGQDLFPKYKLIAGLIGGLLGGVGIGNIANAGAKAANAWAGVGNDMTDAYATAGVTPRLAGDVTQSPTLQSLQAFASKQPLGIGRMTAAANATLDEFGRSAEGTASALGSSRTPQDVGQVLQGETAKWLNNFRTTSEQKWNLLDQYVPGNTQVPVTNYASALAKIAKDLEGAPETASILQPGLSGKLYQALGNDAAGSGASTGQLSLPWSTVKGIRTRIGEMLSDPNLPADTGEAELKRIYGGLSEDMKGAVSSAGPDAQSAFADASNFTKTGHGFIDGVLKPIVRKGQTPEGAAQSVLGKLNKGGTVISQVRAQMPTAADEIAAYKIRDMAASTAGAQNAAGTAVSPSSFLTDWNKMAPEARDALFTDSGTQDTLGALAKISEGIKQTMSKMNTSNTQPASAWEHLFGTLKNVASGAGAGYAAGHFGGFGGLPGAIAGGGFAAAEPLGGYLSALLTSSPRLTSYFAAPGAGLGPLGYPTIAGIAANGSLPRNPPGQVAQ